MRRAALLCLLPLPLAAQSFTSRGYLELRNTFYPQTAVNDAGRAVSEATLRWDAGWRATPWLSFNTAIEAAADTHRQFERTLRLDWRDNGLLRPALSARRFSATLRKGPLTFEAGRQLIRWGKADILNPTDRFAPRDFLNVLDTRLLGVTAARLTWERGGDTLDAVYAPVFTPSRLPLLNQRWVALPDTARAFELRDAGARLPGGGQYGLRWNHVASHYEFSTSVYEGFHHLPVIEATPRSVLDISRAYPKLRMYGADAAVPLRWVTLKAEAAFHHSPQRQADDYWIYVVQLERQTGEWYFIGGYAGDHVARQGAALQFAPDRGVARTFLGRATYTLDANRSLAFEGALRRDGAGGYAKFEYSHARGAHWRATAAAALLAGRRDDFFGQYRRNSNLSLTLRYSF